MTATTSSRSTAPMSTRRAPRGARRVRFPSLRAREQLAGYLFVAPQVLGYLVFVIGPMFAVVWYSLHSYNPLTNTSKYVGGANYTELARDPYLNQILISTVIFVAALVPVGVLGALFLAMLINRRFRGVTFFRALFFAPTLVSLAAWAIVWRLMLQDNGEINGILRLVGINGPNWLHEPGLAMASVVAVQALKGFGINMMIFVAAMQSIPAEQLEAARIDGASSFTIYRRIVLPLISPEIMTVVMLMIIGAFQSFAQVILLTNGGPGYSTTLLAFYIYQQAFAANNYGYACALALLLFVVLLLLTGILWGIRKRIVFYERD